MTFSNPQDQERLAKEIAGEATLEDVKREIAGEEIVHYDYVGDKVYIGKATPGSVKSAAVWQIRRQKNSTNGIVSVLFADGNADYDNIWDNRTELDYS